MLDLAQPEQQQPRLAPDLAQRLEFRLVDRDGPMSLLVPDGRRAGGFRATVTYKDVAATRAIEHAWEVELSLVSYEEQAGLGVQVVLPLEGAATHFMIPGLIYGENRRPDCRARYPRVGTAGDALTADRWAFRTERASHGVVFGWSATSCLALATDEQSSLGATGLGFGASGEPYVALNFPGREEPVTYLGHDAAAPAEVMTHDWLAGEIATLRFWVFQSPPDPHAYDAVLRFLYQRDRARHELRPWMSVEEAAELTAHGLHRWHYRPETGILAETTAFHREIDEHAPVSGDREAMHVAWLSGAPSAFALLTYGRKNGIAEYANAAVSVLDTIAGGLAPCGSFWGRWTPDGWDGGWNRHHDRVHARTIAEATLFMTRAIKQERSLGVEHPTWDEAIRSNLDFAVRSQREDGAFPSLFNGRTGNAESWDGAAGLLWIPALLEGASLIRPSPLTGEGERVVPSPLAGEGERVFPSPLTGEGERVVPSPLAGEGERVVPSPLAGEGQGGGYRAAAELAGSYYTRFVDDEFIFGAPEDIDLAPSSEDGYNAVIAYVGLYEATAEQRWLELARKAAEWTLSFRWSYNLTFPAHSLLESYDYRSRGADLASPRNQHLHTYGLICLPELLRVAEVTGDTYFRDRALDHLACALQFIAREDGDFNARKGMVTERYYNTRCFGPKGALLPVSHAWTVGLVLYACGAGIALDL